MRRCLQALWLFMLCAGCGEAFKPETLLSSLRLLGMKSEPASLRPGETAALSALVVDPSRPGQANAVLWLGCDPDPLNLGRTACSNTQTVTEPTSLAADTSSLPPGTQLIGFNDQAFYSVPQGLFDVLPPGDRRRQVGTVGQVLALVLAEPVNPLAPREELEALLERVRQRQVSSLVVLYRILISESTEVNGNPVLSGLSVQGTPLPEGATLRLRPEETVELSVEVPDSSFETFTAYLPESEEVQTERLKTSYYSTTGRFSEMSVALQSETVQEFTAPGGVDDPIPLNRTGNLYTVVRDTRGGQAWKSFPLYICDASLPAPRATAFSSSGSTLTLEGENLSSTLEVWVGGQVLGKGAYSSSTGRFVGELPPLPPGNHAVLVRGKHCLDVETGLTVAGSL